MQFNMKRADCFECCCIFLIPEQLFIRCAQGDKPIHCPCCGTENLYDAPGPESLPLEDRQKQIQALHDAEQSEAREADQAAAPKRGRPRKA